MRKFYLPLYSGFISRIRKSFRWIAVITLFLVSTSSYATHLAGGELTYQWISGTTYKFTATFYRDCAGIAAPTTLPFNYKSANCGVNNNATLNLVAGTGQEITFPCQSAGTKCSNSSSPNPGFQEWQYTATVNLGKKCNDWIFSWVSNARNNAITTIQNPGADNMYIEAMLNNLSDSTASSPTFSNYPVALICVGQSFTYNHGALDPNGDSLVYSFIAPRTDPGVNVVYINPYSATNPIASTPSAAINSSTGDITMNPTTIQVGVTTVLVKKYHKGVFVGSVIRDMEFITQNCGTNNLPTASGVNGTAAYGDTICAGIGSPLCFTILSNDADVGQIVTMTWNSGIIGATFNVTGASHPVGTFCWKPTYADASSIVHTFTVTVKDNNCPSNGVQVFSYFILVPPIIVTPSTSNIACNGGTGTATAVGSGGISPYTYSWSPTSQTTATATGLSAGTTYTVTTTDKHGCTNTNTIALTQPTAISASISSSTDVTCNGLNNGSATVTASGGTGAFTHHWNDGQTTNPAINLAAGNYTDTVKDANGCIKLVSVTISQPSAALSASINSQQDVTCKGLANGTITLTVTGGTRPYTYAWSPSGGTDSTATGLLAGTYTVTVTDSHGCTTTKSAIITEPSIAQAIITNLTVTGGIISCYGSTNGSLSVSVTGGTPSYTYLWSPGGATTDTITGLAAGTISVHVTDSHGCTADTSITLTQPDSLIATIPDFSSYFGGVNVSCNGATDGFINTTITGGTPGYQFLWSPGGETTQDIANIGAGTYTISVTDTNGCTAIQSITLIEPALLVAAESSHTNVGCNGEASGGIVVGVTGGTAPYTYVWSPNVSSDSVATGLSAGTYSVDVSDMNGCVTTLIDSISQPDSVYVLISAATVTGGLNIACTGDSSGSAWVTISGGTAPFNYFWSNGATTDTVFGIGAGPLSVHVVDAHGCSKDANDTISQPEPVSAFYVLSTYTGGANVSCFGAADGSITQVIVGGGTPGYSYLWNNGETGPNDTGLVAGTYTVMITDTNGCRDSLSFVLTAPQSLTDTISALVTNGGWNISCNGAADGSITISVSGGNEPYSYSWSPNVSTTSTASGLGAGTYIITATDTNGCSIADSITLIEPLPLFDTLSARTYIGGKNVSCFGYTDGFIADSVSGGTPPYTFVWSTTDTTQNLDSTAVQPITAGTYVVNITDANGCTITDSITLIQPDSISQNPIITQYSIYNIQCNGGLGCINLNPTGGTAGYKYLWTPTEDSTKQFCDTAGTYNVVVTDTNGCFSSANYTLTQPDSLISAFATSNYGGSNVSCNGTADGTITITATGGVLPYTYSWSPNVSTDSSATGLGAGTYIITVADSNGCSTVVTSTLIAPPPFTDSVSTSLYAGGYNISCAGNDGSITIVPTGGTRPYHYVWSPPVSTDSSAVGLDAGLYVIMVTDSNGCSHTDSVTLTVAVTFTVTDSLSDYNGYNVSCNGSTNGSIHVILSGGVPPFTFHWSNDSTTQDLTNLGAGTYVDTITNAQGCITIDSVTLVAPQVLTVLAVDSNYNGSGIKCSGDNTGYIHLEVSGGAQPITYNWVPNVSTDSIASNLGAGTYVYTITDANGCSTTDSTILTSPQPVNLSVIDSTYNGSGVSCNGSTNGYIHLIATGGTQPITYTWVPNVSTDSIASNLGAGTYVYTISDANGCSITDSTTLTAPQAVSLSAIDSTYNGSGVSCNGSTNGYIHLIATGGTQPITYTWVPNVSSDSIASNLGAGTYVYTVSDANGCSITDSTTLTAPQAVNLSVIDSSYNGNGVSCNGSTNGYIHLVVTGGTQPIIYSWVPNVSTDSIASNLGAGTYVYTITDANGCTVTDSTTLNAPQVVSLGVIDSSYNGSSVSCNGSTNGYIHLVVTGGTQPITYSWSPGVSIDSIANNLGAGTYTYTVTDANGCSATGSQTLTEPTPLTDSLSSPLLNGTNNVSCNGDSTGSVTINVSGGTTNYMYAWSNGETTQTATNLTAQTYTVTVTDQNGCTVTGSITLTQPPPISVDAGGSGQVCGTSATLSGSIPAGSNTGTWSASGSGTFNPDANDPNATVSGLDIGTNILQWSVTDGICTSTDTVSIEAFDSGIAANGGPNDSICPDKIGDAMLNAAPVKLGVGIWSSLGKATVNDSLNPITGVKNLSDLGNTFVWLVTNGPCVASDTVIVYLKTDADCVEGLEMPTAFSPNGDNVNDFFIIHGISKYPLNSFKVFNRWGNEVYSVDNYDNLKSNHTWAGQNKSGEQLPDGTYYAILLINNTNIQLHGYVDLRK